MRKKPTGHGRILLLFSRNSKADRERLTGALRFIRENPRWDVRVANASSFDFRNEIRHAVSGWQPDGVIYSDPAICAKLLTLLAKRPRLAEIDYHTPDLHPQIRVSVDDAVLARSAAQLFIRRGYRHLAYFGTGFSREALHSSARSDGIRGVAIDTNASFSAYAPAKLGAGRSHDLNSAARWLRKLSKPCGILAYADEEARDLYDAALLAGISIPHQISIIGIDNEADICDNLSPTLTSVFPDFELSGRIAAQTLTGNLKTRKRVSLSYGVREIVERASSQDVSGAGRIASAVNELLRTEATHADTTVAGLAGRLNMSRRLMEIHYKSVMGRTIQDELHRIRLENAKKLLAESDMPIGEIALNCGYRTVIAAQAIFKRRIGMPMRDYRTRAKECPIRD